MHLPGERCRLNPGKPLTEAESDSGLNLLYEALVLKARAAIFPAILPISPWTAKMEIERGLVKPFLMGKDVHRYEPVVPQNVVIFPYIIRAGRAILMSQKFIQEQFPLGWQYLIENRKALSERVKRENVWR